MQRHLVRRFKIISGVRGEAEASVNKLLSDPKVENIIHIGDTCVCSIRHTKYYILFIFCMKYGRRNPHDKNYR